ncbi:hypothetical protein H072_6462 [Dactylellina haptotyla CBS 200.50]|uniref:F-box domain-containing protein n=1 Tax=Dactylellina haptotyla (strain CBS 200.50) TaxID=1284197 RepID=S8BWN7_DACHA|nr:hypothetical protein H072_6462 [Dactylellina haptotyla CBS 200.50]
MLEPSLPQLSSLPVELIYAISSFLPTSSLFSLILTSKHLHSALKETYLRAAHSTFTLYPTPKCAAYLRDQLVERPYYVLHLKHLKISLQCPQFNPPFMKWFCQAYNQGRRSTIPNPDALMKSVESPENHKAKFFIDILENVLHYLDGLETIEFVHTFEPIPWSHCKQCNDPDWFKIPDLEQYRYVRSPLQYGMFQSDFLYPITLRWVFNAVFASGRPIKHVLYNFNNIHMGSRHLRWNYKGVTVLEFPSYEDIMTQYNKTLKDLRTLQLRVSARGMDEPSKWFEVMQNLRELWLSDDYGTPPVDVLSWRKFVVYPLRRDAVLPHLRKLELRHAAIPLESLTSFLLNNRQVEYLKLQENMFHLPPMPIDQISPDTRKADIWIEFFEMLFKNLNLNYFDLDISPGAGFPKTPIYLTVKGRWDLRGEICEIKETRTDRAGDLMSVLQLFEYLKKTVY